MKIKYNKPNIHTAPAGKKFVQLRSGVNDVPDDLAKQMLDHPAMQARVESGVVEVIGGGKATVVDGTSDFAIERATKDELEAYAKEHHNVDLDKRKGVDSLRDEVKALEAE